MEVVDFFGIIVLVVFCIFARQICSFVQGFWLICRIICDGLTSILKFICTPFLKIGLTVKNKIIGQIPRKDHCLTSFAVRHPTLGTPKSIIFIILSVLFIVGMVLFYKPQDADTFLTDILCSFPITYVALFIIGEVEFTFIGLFSSGISIILLSLLTKLFMDDYEIYSFGSGLVSIVHYIVTMAVSCTLSYLLRGVWAWLANTGFQLFDILKVNVFNSGATFMSWITAIACVILLIIILYIALIIAITSVRDSLDMISYGVVGFLLASFICFFVDTILGIFNVTISYTFSTICMIVFILGFDYYRINIDNFR